MADALELKIQELAAAAQRQKDFTASFAHELKTPLTSVIGYADTLRSRELPRLQQLEAVNYIFSEGKRLEAMSFSLLDLFALERTAPQLVTVQAQALARAVAESMGYVMSQSGWSFGCLWSPVPSGEPNLLKTLLYNLLDNARKASQSGSSVELLGCTTLRVTCSRSPTTAGGIPRRPWTGSPSPSTWWTNPGPEPRAVQAWGWLCASESPAPTTHSALRFESRVGAGTTVSLILGGSEP